MSGGSIAPMTEDPPPDDRELVLGVLLETIGATATPWIPIPFVDDWFLSRFLERITRKVLARNAATVPENTPQLHDAIVAGYTSEGSSSLAVFAIVSLGRFLVRKLAVVLDVKKSHDLFGESIAYALALDVAARKRLVHPLTARLLGRAIFRAVQGTGKGLVQSIARASQGVFASKKDAGDASRRERFAASIAGDLAKARAELAAAVEREMKAPAPEA